MEFNNRLAANNANILELQAVVREQETVLGSYKSKFQ